MQTGYEVSSLSVPVISRINDWAEYIAVATPFLQWQGVALHVFQRPKINPGYRNPLTAPVLSHMTECSLLPPTGTFH